MKFKLTKSLKDKVSKIQSRVKEPEQFENTRKILYALTVFICVFWLPIKFLYFMNMDMKWIGFLCGSIMMGMYLLISMIQPGSKTFWLLFANFFITMPLASIFFPFEALLEFSSIFEAIFGLLPLWIPIVYLVFFTWKNIKLKKQHREQYIVRVQENKNIKLKRT